MSKRQLISALLAFGLMVGEIAGQQVHSFAPDKMDNVLYGVAYYAEYMPYDRLENISGRLRGRLTWSLKILTSKLRQSLADERSGCPTIWAVH